jgi:hypothetical protein
MNSNVKSLLLFDFENPLTKRHFFFRLLSLLKSIAYEVFLNFVVVCLHTGFVIIVAHLPWRILVDRGDLRLSNLLFFCFFLVVGEVDKFALDNVEVLVHNLVFDLRYKAQTVDVFADAHGITNTDITLSVTTFPLEVGCFLAKNFFLHPQE